MALCVNQSGTWREITTNCVNVSGTWRNIEIGCINQSGTWRKFGFDPELGDAYGGGYLICQSGGVRWVVAPSSSQVSRTWFSRNDAITTAQSVSGCTGWFVPTCGQIQNPGFFCRTYWDSYSNASYWSISEVSSYIAWHVSLNNGAAGSSYKTTSFCVRAFRCVTY